jgi:magnesium transporter
MPTHNARQRDSRPSLASVTGRQRDSRSSIPSMTLLSERWISPEPAPGAAPGTLVLEEQTRPRMRLMDYCSKKLHEQDLQSVDECIPYLIDDTPSITWIDIQGIGDRATFERLGEIFKLHPLALEDVVNVPQRPKTDAYPEQQLIIGRMVQCAEGGCLRTEQISILFGKGFVVTVQEEPDRDVLDPVRERIRHDRGFIRAAPADYLAYALLDAIIDGFFPALELLGERLEDLELEVAAANRSMSRAIHDIKRELLTVRRSIWPQRDLLNALLRDDSPHVSKETRLYLRDTYDHAVQVMDMVETFREIASGLMDLYLSGVSNRMNEIMKFLTIISTIFLPLTFIAGVYGMNFDPNASPYNMPELRHPYGYEMALGMMAASAIGLLVYYRKKGWLGGSSAPDAAARDDRPT